MRLFCFLLSGDVKEFGSTLDVRGLKGRTQSQSNVDILISPCDPNRRPPHTCPASPQSEQTEANMEKPAEKTRLEAAASFPLERSKVTQYLSSPTLSGSLSSTKSISSIVYSPAHQDQGDATSLNPPWLTAGLQISQHASLGSPPLPQSGGDESKQEVEDRTSRPSEELQGGEMVGSKHGNGGEEGPSEELLLGEDRMYPTLRSKSMNTNPRKTRTKRKENEEMPRSTGSVRDLVSAFRGGVVGPRSSSRSRDSDY